MPKMGVSQVIDFDRVSSPGVSVSEKSYHRIERFLTRMFPTRRMRRFAHVAGETRLTRLRQVTYEVITQEKINYVLAGYSAQWNEPIHELAIYRVEPDGPNQVWRSRLWEGNASDLHFFAAPASGRNVVFFQEGGAEGTFSLASVFTFKNAPSGLLLHDLTPELPWLRARAYFPFRTLYGEQISMRVEPDGSQTLKNSDKNEVVLSASDEEFNLGMSQVIRPRRSWKYNSLRNRFERMKPAPAITGPEATNNR
jgi:hypothetical protein